VRYEDAITISTPEGVDLELRLAGLGSRFTAALVDIVIRVVLLIAVALLLRQEGVFVGEPVTGIEGAAFVILFFLIVFGYDVFFETLASGRTPGKRWSGLRVVLAEGRPIGFLASAVRNVVRLIDFLPAGYAIGCVSILVSAKNQRLGDIAAGTLVIRDRIPAPPPAWPPRASAAMPEALAWDVSAITAEELGAVRRFLERRFDLTPEARAQLGSTLAERLRPKVAGAPDDLHVEAFLETLAAAKAARR
jgi:uncharacterized RDD family membrane protein YckC